MPEINAGSAATAHRLAFPLAVPIELPEGGHVTDFRDVTSWEEQRAYNRDTTAERRPIELDQFIDEDHHRIYGRPWLLGRYCFDYLRSCGLKRSDRFLDLGCGTGRVGIWLIRYLDAGNYFGIDSHLPSLVGFSAYEMVLHGLAHKAPRLLLGEAFEIDRFGGFFDVSLELSVTIPRNGRQAYEKIAAHMKPGGRCFFLKEQWKFPAETLEEIGLRHVRTDEVHYPLFAKYGRKIDSIDQWDVLTKI